MVDEKSLTASEVAELRERWMTAEGMKIKSALLASLRAGKWDWPDFLVALPTVSVPAPYPELLDDLRGLTLSREMLDGVSMSHSDLSYSVFEECSLKKASFQMGRLIWANLTGSQLHKADLLQVVADHSVFDGCTLTGAMMLSGEYRHSSFRGADLRQSVLNGCRFVGADLSGALFQSAEAHNLDIETL